MNTIANTAYYCCGVGMEDAEREFSVVNDVYAKRFMDERGLEIVKPFKSETVPNISNITRCRIIDDIVSDELSKDRIANVAAIGAGFDTRPYRLNGGVWTEIDDPQIIDYKNAKLPIVECPNTLSRISIGFSSESLADKLAAVGINLPVIIVIEGVSMYLDQRSIREMLRCSPVVALTARRCLFVSKCISMTALEKHFPEYLRRTTNLNRRAILGLIQRLEEA